jgi:hypothetical protein
MADIPVALSLPSWDACKDGDVTALERLISRGLTAVEARAYDNYALRKACRFGHAHVVCARAAAEWPGHADALARLGPAAAAALDALHAEATLMRYGALRFAD